MSEIEPEDVSNVESTLLLVLWVLTVPLAAVAAYDWLSSGPLAVVGAVLAALLAAVVVTFGFAMAATATKRVARRLDLVTVGTDHVVERELATIDRCDTCGTEDTEGIVTTWRAEEVLFGVSYDTVESGRNEDCLACAREESRHWQTEPEGEVLAALDAESAPEERSAGGT